MRTSTAVAPPEDAEFEDGKLYSHAMYLAIFNGVFCAVVFGSTEFRIILIVIDLCRYAGYHCMHLIEGKWCNMFKFLYMKNCLFLFKLIVTKAVWSCRKPLSCQVLAMRKLDVFTDNNFVQSVTRFLIS